MRAFGLVFAVVLVSFPAAHSVGKTAKIKVTVNAIDKTGVGKSVGTVTLTETKDGLQLQTDLKGLPPGEHGFHVHQNPSCDAAPKDGQPTAGQAAGGHLDPAGTNAHKGPGGGGHLGDLPKLTVSEKGTSKEKLTVPGLKLSEVQGRSLMIHAGGDNYADQPKPLGGGGDRIACGVVPAAK